MEGLDQLKENLDAIREELESEKLVEVELVVGEEPEDDKLESVVDTLPDKIG